jgi:hypothetical protein
MEWFLIVGGLAAAALVIGCLAAGSAPKQPRYDPAQQAADAAARLAQERARQRAVRERQRADERRRLNQLYRDMQIALMRVDQAPDFRRAAAFAARARAVPAELRQRQFQRFRAQLIEYFASRVQAGTDEQVLLQSLRALVSALGVADFEADYIHGEARRSRPTAPPPVRTYDEQLRGLQEQHDQRVQTIRDLPALDDEIREQLLEAEHERFRDTVLALGDGGRRNGR